MGVGGSEWELTGMHWSWWENGLVQTIVLLCVFIMSHTHLERSTF